MFKLLYTPIIKHWYTREEEDRIPFTMPLSRSRLPLRCRFPLSFMRIPSFHNSLYSYFQLIIITSILI